MGTGQLSTLLAGQTPRQQAGPGFRNFPVAYYISPGGWVCELRLMPIFSWAIKTTNHQIVFFCVHLWLGVWELRVETPYYSQWDIACLPGHRAKTYSNVKGKWLKVTRVNIPRRSCCCCSRGRSSELAMHNNGYLWHKLARKVLFELSPSPPSPHSHISNPTKSGKREFSRRSRRLVS